jgi:hypothetical protein
MTFSAGAEQYLVARKTGEPYHSYYFRFLTHQGAKLFQRRCINQLAREDWVEQN